MSHSVKDRMRAIYDRMPLRLRAPGLYWETLELLRQSQYWDQDRLLEYQLNQLRQMLEHCAANVPYYRKLFHQIGFNPSGLKHASDITCIPTLDRQTVTSNVNDLLAENISSSKRLYYTTGGTMGKPLGLYGLREAGWRERAFMETQWARAGFRRDRLRAMLKGAVVKNRSHYRYDPREHAFLFSNFHMSPEVVAGYAAVM